MVILPVGGGVSAHKMGRGSTLRYGGVSTLEYGDGGTLIYGGGSTLGCEMDGGLLVSGWLDWYDEILTRRFRTAVCLVDGSRTGPSGAGCNNTLVRAFTDVITRSMDDGVCMDTFVWNQERVSEFRLSCTSGTHMW